MACPKSKSRRAELEEPDSTTKEADFGPGQDVLLKQKDGRYYLGTVVEVDAIREQCLVKFGDNTDSWSSFKDLTKLSTPQQEDLLCVVCKKSTPKHNREITVCDKCGRGYHRKCHQPEIPNECQKQGNYYTKTNSKIYFNMIFFDFISLFLYTVHILLQYSFT